MSHLKKYLSLFEVISIFLLIMGILSLCYHIQLSVVAYDQTYSTPLSLTIIVDTYIWILLSVVILIIYICIHKSRKKSGFTIVNLNIRKYFRSHKIKFSMMILLLMSILAILMITLIQPYILYHPNHSTFAYDSLIKSDVYQTFEIADGKNTYHGFGYIDQEQVRPTLIYFGGNGESSAQTFYNYDQLNFFDHFNGFNFIMIDYPGYGLSDGKTSDRTMLQMAESVYDYVTALEYVSSTEIYVYGYSIGTGVATYIASIKDVKGLILIAPYSNITDLFNSRLPIFKGLGSSLIREEFKSDIYALDVQVKPLIIMSKEDLTVPYELSLKLAESFSISPQLLILESGAHNEFLDQLDVAEHIISYLN